jgi:hypothetical protein
VSKMKDVNGCESSLHPEIGLLAYAEGDMTTSEKLDVEKHLRTCTKCAGELDLIKQIVEALKTEKTIFCPEPWELQEFVDSGKDIEGRISAHIAECGFCGNDIAEMRGCCESESIPESLRKTFRTHCGTHYPESFSSSFLGRLSLVLRHLWESSRIPAMALGTAAAAVLLFVMFYPAQMDKDMVGLSSVNWTAPSGQLIPKMGINLMGAVKKKPRIAVIIVFKGFRKPFAQSNVDSIYLALQPSQDVAKLFEIVNPSEVKKILDSTPRDKSDISEIVASLRKDLSISRLVVATVVKDGNGFKLASELIDADENKTLARSTEISVTGTELVNSVKAAVYGILDQSTKSNG